MPDGKWSRAFALVVDRPHRRLHVACWIGFSRGEEMSDPRSKAEQSKAKDLRQGIVVHSERSRNSHPKKQSRPWKIMSNFPFLLKLKGSSVFCAHRSPTKDAAEAWVRKRMRSGYAKAEDYWIEGPDDRNSEESAK